MAVIADRLSLRWYVGYDFYEPLPDYSSLTKIRERYGVETFRRFFEVVLERCRATRLLWGAELYADATKVRRPWCVPLWAILRAAQDDSPPLGAHCRYPEQREAPPGWGSDSRAHAAPSRLPSGSHGPNSGAFQK